MNMRDFDRACELLPEGVTWGEAITPSIVKHIAEAVRTQQQQEVTDEQILHLQHEFYNFRIRRISRQKLHANVRSILLQSQPAPEGGDKE